MRVALFVGRIQSHSGQKIVQKRINLFRFYQVVYAGCFGYDLPDSHSWIQRCIRILEDHLHGEFCTAPGCGFERIACGAAVEHCTGGRFKQPGNHASQSGFSATRFSGQSHDLARQDSEVDAIHCSHYFFMYLGPQSACHPLDEIGCPGKAHRYLPKLDQWWRCGAHTVSRCG